MTAPETNCVRLRRVRLIGQPLGLGFLLAAPGAYLGWNMLLAVDFSEHWALTASTFLLILAFFAMFAQGVWYLLMPLHTLLVTREEIQLRLGPLVLRRLPVDQIRSVTSEMRTVLVRNRSREVFRIKFYRRGASFREKPLWMDWSLAAEQRLKGTLQDVTFLF